MTSRNLSNLRKEDRAKLLVLGDPRYQRLSNDVMRAVLTRLLGPSGERFRWSVRTVDLVKTPEPMPPLTVGTALASIDDLILIEIKATETARVGRDLEGFFFGTTLVQHDIGLAMGERFRYCFVQLDPGNPEGEPWWEERTAAEVGAQIRSVHFQAQITLGPKPLRGANGGHVL